jgi:hypothetical protein
MTKLNIAHIREQGQDMVIVQLDRSYGYKSQAEQNQIRNTIQYHAATAGLAGTIVTVWDAGGGRMGFIAPAPWRAFFSRLDLHTIACSVNRTLSFP